MQAVTPVFDIASRVSSPLALAGLTLAVVFFIFRQLLAKNIFPMLSRAIGAALLRQIVDRLFILALVAMCLGAAGYMLPRFLPGSPRRDPPAAADAEKALIRLYAHQYQEFYDSLSPELRSRVTFAAFLAQTRKSMSQFSAPPLHRRFVGIQTAAGYSSVTFEAEFDQRSRYSEILSYAETPNGWILVSYEIDPADWPLTSLATLIPEPTAEALFHRLGKLPASQLASFVNSDVAGRWIPSPGWTASFEKVLTQKDTRTCDIQLREASTGALLTAKDVLDGCTLEKARSVTVLGRVEAATGHSAEISSVRWLANEMTVGHMDQPVRKR